MQAHPTRRQVIVGAVAFRCVERRSDRRTAAGNRLSSSARRKGDWDVPFRILSTATLLDFHADYAVRMTGRHSERGSPRAAAPAPPLHVWWYAIIGSRLGTRSFGSGS